MMAKKMAEPVKESKVKEWAEAIGWFLLMIVMVAFFIGIVWIVWMVAKCFIAFGNAPCHETVEDTRIYSLVLSDKVQGSFVLGIGGFGTHETYYAFEESQGGKLLQEYGATYTVLIESNETPVHRRYRGEGWGGWNCPMKMDALVVPPGTVKVQYNVDINQ